MAYNQAPDAFEWSVLKPLEYAEREDDHSDDLELLYMICLEEILDVKPMKPGKR
ncbi:MAG: hypothetical protein Q4A55_03280 [Aerococcus sp.]|nr:hypothetical protein [Aerococcus sp.]